MDTHTIPCSLENINQPKICLKKKHKYTLGSTFNYFISIYYSSWKAVFIKLKYYFLSVFVSSNMGSKMRFHH